jgi:hypothetical protein
VLKLVTVHFLPKYYVNLVKNCLGSEVLLQARSNRNPSTGQMLY